MKFPSLVAPDVDIFDYINATFDENFVSVKCILLYCFISFQVRIKGLPCWSKFGK